MSLFHSPRVVTDGLVFYYDMSNTQKSWKGAPTTNLLPTPLTISSTWTKEGGFGTVTPDYGNAPDDTQTSTLCVFTGGYLYYTLTLTPGITYTFSCYVKGGAQTGRGIGLWSYAVGGIVAASSQSINANTWTRVSVTYTVASGASSFAIMLAGYPSNIFQGTIEVWRPQLEVNSFASPFVNGTRSTTQAIIDLTNNNTITATSLTYASDGTFSFNGASSVINIGPSTRYLPLESHTLEAWVKSPGLGAGMNTSCVFGITYGIIVQIYANGNVQYYAYNTDSGSAVVLFQLYSTGVNLLNNAWHHIVCTRTSAAASIYIDGVLNATGGGGGSWTGNNIWSAMDGLIGNNPNDAYYWANGYIGSAKIYKKALSASEVYQNFNAHRSRYGI